LKDYDDMSFQLEKVYEERMERVRKEIEARQAESKERGEVAIPATRRPSLVAEAYKQLQKK